MVWRLLKRKTPTNIWAKPKGISLASKSYNCHSNAESDYHSLFQCNLATSLCKWLFSLEGISCPNNPSVEFIWTALCIGRDDYGKKSAAAIFFHLFSILWTFHNDSKFNNIKPSLPSAKSLFKERISNLLGTLADRINVQQLHPLVLSLDRFGH